MTIWRGIKQLHVKALSNLLLNKTFSQINAPPCLINHSRFCLVDRQACPFSIYPFQFGNNARFFAAPVQVKTKLEQKDSDEGPKLNEEIRAPYIRLVTDEGHGVVTRYEALQRAKALKLDLVEVDRHSKPPVCKIMDYHKEKFQKELKEKERAKSKKSESLRSGTHKEVRISGKIEKKDLQMKADTVRRMTERGYRVKCMAVGKEDEDLGTLLSRLAALIEDFCIVESGPKVERRQAFVIVRHAKFGPSKKGKKKEKIIVPPSTFTESEDNMVEEDPRVENENTSTLSDSEEDLPSQNKNKSTWSVFDKKDDYDEVFDIGNNASQVTTASQAQPAVENRYKRGPTNGVRPTRQVNEDSRNSTRFDPRFQNQGGQRQFDPSTPPLQSPSFGQFSAQKVNNNDPQRRGGEPAEVNRYSSQRQNGPADMNRYSSQRPAEGNRYSSQRQNGPAEVNNRYNRGPAPNAPPSTSQGKERPFYDKGGPGRPGMNPHLQDPTVNSRGSSDRQYDGRR